jgi:general stress protein 26
LNPKAARRVHASRNDGNRAMTEKTLADLAQRMREIDIAMLSTHTDGGAIASRPMSNNGEVKQDGTSYYFTWEQSRMVADIEVNAEVALSFQGPKAFAVAIEGKAELIRDKSAFQAHWTPDLDHWFEQGIDTPGVVMIKVHAKRIHYWDGVEDGEITL